MFYSQGSSQKSLLAKFPCPKPYIALYPGEGIETSACFKSTQFQSRLLGSPSRDSVPGLGHSITCILNRILEGAAAAGLETRLLSTLESPVELSKDSDATRDF